VKIVAQAALKAGSFLIASAAVLTLVNIGFAPALAETTPANAPLTDAALDHAIHDYILAHPEVLMQSLQRAKQNALEQQAAGAKSKIVSLRKDLLEDPDSPVFGNPNGDVTIVEFFDYRCSYCRQVEPWLQTLIKDDPGVRIVQKELPILGPASVFAARVMLAAQRQGKQMEFHNAAMKRKANLEEAAIIDLAKQAGLDVDLLKKDMNSQEVDSELRRTMEIAKALNLSGTPALILGTELIPGATDLATLKSMVSDARRGVE
jgi:protein-disulfide isomerase